MTGPDLRTHWDITFEWTDLHQTSEQLRPQMFTYDKLADDCVARLNEIDPPKNYRPQPGETGTKHPKRDLLGLVEKYKDDDPVLEKFWTEINTTPEWVDWAQIKRGQEVFFRYGMPILNVLSFESLLGGMGSFRVVETLARTGGFSADVVRRRLLETLQHVLQVSMSLESMKPGGAGHQSSVRVRLLHSSVRSRIFSLVKEKPEYYDIEKFGVPVSDLDCVATINTFSTSVIWIGLPRQGIYLRDQEIQDYLALWRLVAYYMGTPTEPFASKASGKAIMESLLASEIDPKEIGQVLAKNIIIGLENTAPTFASKEFMEAMARHLNGDKLSDRLDIPKTNFYYQTLIYGYLFIVMGLAYSNRVFPLFDKAWIAVRRKLYYMIITDKEHGLGGESIFEFKYVPWFTRTTKLGKRKERKATKPGIEALAQLGVLAACASAATVFYGAMTGLQPGERADLEPFDLANTSPSYTPSSAAPDHPEIPFPAELPPSHPNVDSAPGGTPLSPHQESALGHSIPSTAADLSSAPHSRRRRRSSVVDTPDIATEGIGSSLGGYRASDAGFEEQSTIQSRAPREGHPPSPKRRRLANMRPDGILSINGSSQTSKGSASSPSYKAGFPHTLNGQVAYGSNGDLQTNGSQRFLADAPPYFGHDREEVTRILIQSLHELGYDGAASLLSKESGYQLESPAVTAFRNAVLQGQWAEAERILVQSFYSTGHGRALGGDQMTNKEKLVLVENAEKNEMLFYLRQQKFLELLDARNLGAALMVLRHELTPLNYDIGRLHALSSLLMCPPEHLHDQAGWDGPISSSREQLLSELSKSISPSVMIPENRLATLLDHVKQNQINKCLYHNTAASPSLYSDHMCDRNDFPLAIKKELNDHSDEVWHCQFSHDGTKLVTAGRDKTVIIYDIDSFEVLHTLHEHDDGVAHAVWSPDDSKLITCSTDKTARVWSVETGRCLLTINHHRQPVTAAVWAADGESFVTASLDLNSQLCHWSMRGQPLHTWPGGFRVQDCAITPDGRRLVAVDVDKKIRVFNFATHEEEYILPLKSKATSIVISRDSRHMLVNLADCQIQLIDIETTEVIRRFQGQKQSIFIIRSTFGGAAENFVVSGSEDSRIYVWHKENGTLVETLEGHVSGCVNAISWNPVNPGMFASAGDDCLVKIWTRERDANTNPTPGKKSLQVSGNGYARTSALRSTSSF